VDPSEAVHKLLEVQPSRSANSPPEWAFTPVAAWIYLALVIALALTPVFPLNWVLGIVAAVFVYQDRRASEMPAFWWTAGVIVLGPLLYLFYVYKRPSNPVVFSPNAVVAQQGRIAKGLPPIQATPAAASSNPAADWYPDPSGEARLRYWDGLKWTEHTAN
jgi:Protein of unknown function (DUF2510)